MYEYIGSIDHLDFDSDVYPWNLCCQGTCSRSKLEFPMLNLTKKYILYGHFHRMIVTKLVPKMTTESR